MDPSENIEEFLHGSLPAPDAPAFRDRLWQRTSRVLWRRRWQHRLVQAGTLAACFLLGAACMRLWTPAKPREQPSAAHAQVQPPAPAPQRKEPAPELPIELAALVQEWNAFDDREQQRKLYREAGDLYFHANHDYEAALRCYTQALDAASDQDLAVSPDDNWLLMALKEARLKEKKDARNDG